MSPDFDSVNFVEDVDEPLPHALNAKAITELPAAVAFLLFFSSVSLTNEAKTFFPFTTRDATDFFGNILTLSVNFLNMKWVRARPMSSPR